VRGKLKNGQKTGDDQKRLPVPQWIAPTISAIAAVIALGSFFFTSQTYYVAQRPYVGIVDAKVDVERDGNKIPVRMAWQFDVKNTGGIPALITMEKHVCHLQQGYRVISFPKLGPVKSDHLIMPNEVDRLPSTFVEYGGVKVQDVYSRKFVLTCDTDFSYVSISGWLKRTFVYRKSVRYIPEFEGFIMDSGYAN
jgi:hypothetical protein